MGAPHDIPHNTLNIDGIAGKSLAAARECKDARDTPKKIWAHAPAARGHLRGG